MLSQISGIMMNIIGQANWHVMTNMESNEKYITSVTLINNGIKKSTLAWSADACKLITLLV